jgi:hypothetical protein
VKSVRYPKGEKTETPYEILPHLVLESPLNLAIFDSVEGQKSGLFSFSPRT